MRRIILLALLSTALFAQHPKQPDETQVLNFKHLHVDPVSTPRTVREFALSQIKEYDDYRKQPKKYGDHLFIPSVEGRPLFSHRYTFLGKEEQGFSVTHDGVINFYGMTAEDAVLLLLGEESERELEHARSYDHIREMQEDAEKNVPPHGIKDGPTRWDIDSVAKLDNGIMADTNCGWKHIRVLETNLNKQDSVLHELMHVATGCNANMKLHSAIYLITPGLLRIMQNNPDVVDYLLYGHHDNPCPPAGCSDGWDWDKRGYLCEKNGMIQFPSKVSCKQLGLKPARWPTIVSAHIVLNSVQAKEQDNEIPQCTQESKTTCYDPTLPNLNFHFYEKKDNCESSERVKCASIHDGMEERFIPIGKPVVYEESEK